MAGTAHIGYRHVQARQHQLVDQGLGEQWRHHVQYVGNRFQAEFFGRCLARPRFLGYGCEPLDRVGDIRAHPHRHARDLVAAGRAFAAQGDGHQPGEGFGRQFAFTLQVLAHRAARHGDKHIVQRAARHAGPHPLDMFEGHAHALHDPVG